MHIDAYAKFIWFLLFGLNDYWADPWCWHIYHFLYVVELFQLFFFQNVLSDVVWNSSLPFHSHVTYTMLLTVALFPLISALNFPRMLISLPAYGMIGLCSLVSVGHFTRLLNVSSTNRFIDDLMSTSISTGVLSIVTNGLLTLFTSISFWYSDHM